MRRRGALSRHARRLRDLLAPSKRPAWLRVDRLLGEWGISKDSPAGRQQLERALEERQGWGGRGIQADPARLVFGGGGISEDRKSVV